MPKKIDLRESDSAFPTKLSVNQRNMHNECMVFNFSFLTKHKKYSLSKLEKDVYKALFHAVEKLSNEHITIILNRPKEQGVEFIERLKHVITPEEFIQTEREKECDDKFCVVRISKKGRLIGKLNGNLFYVLAVDTKFDLYDH